RIGCGSLSAARPADQEGAEQQFAHHPTAAAAVGFGHSHGPARSTARSLTMSRRSGIAAIVVVAAAILFYLSAFTVDLMHSAIVLRFGEPRRVLMEPGLYVRWPNPIESVVLLDNRVLNFDLPSQEFVLGD